MKAIRPKSVVFPVHFSAKILLDNIFGEKQQQYNEWTTFDIRFEKCRSTQSHFSITRCRITG